MAGRLELPPVTDAGDDRGRGDRPNPWRGGEPLAGLRTLVPPDDARFHRVNPSRQCGDMLEHLSNRGAGLVGQEITADLVHPLAEFGNPLNAFPGDDAKFRQQSARRVDRGSSLADEQRANPME
jgi:hypothetical protein